MKYIQILSCTLFLAVAVSAQYNYDKPAPPPTTPRGTYLPPSTPRPEREENVAAEGIQPSEAHEPGMPYDFTYAVKDDYGNDFSRMEESDGDVVKGEYRTLLPDGRMQIVKYTADWKNGYMAEVTYEGEAKYTEPAPRTPRPESNAQIDSQGLTPAAPPRQTTQPPAAPAGLYGAPSKPFGVRNNPKFGYSK